MKTKTTNALKVNIEYTDGTKKEYTHCTGFSPFGPNMIRIDQVIKDDVSNQLIITLKDKIRNLFIPIENIKLIEANDQPIEMEQVEQNSSVVVPNKTIVTQ